jgi:hypothetical protein
MDPAVKAAKELNAIFTRLEVPCEVCVTNEEGKHVKATSDLDGDVALVEELPIVSWPSTSLLNLRLPFCFHCLRISSHQLSAHEGDATSASPSSIHSAPALPEKWMHCAQCDSCFCSVACQQASGRVHRLLCSSLSDLRRSPSPSSSSSSSSGASTAASGISLEALARCVAWIAQRLSLIIGQQRLTHEALQADYNAQRGSDGSVTTSNTASTQWSQDSLNYQLFTQVVAPFSRLISPPDSVQFDGVSLPAWLSVVRTHLADKCVKLLLVASGAPLGTLTLHPLHLDAEEGEGVSGGGIDGPFSLYWAEALVQVLFSTDTLRTLVGQMALNAHGINDYVLPLSGAATNTAGRSHTGAFEWILKGAGLYALLSSFNHSCEPNAAVSSVADTHEIVLKTTRPVKAGEEISITYIPLTHSCSVAERQQLLKHYLFTCGCPRCVREAKPQQVL